MTTPPSTSLHGSPDQFRDRVLDVCESTNDLARRLGESGSPHGSWVSAREQTAGRGRHGRSWISEPGNLFLSVVLRDIPPRELGWVPLVTASFLVDALDRLAAASAAGPYAARIKWPNDVGILGDGQFRKGAGILCEGVSSGAKSFLVVGVGVNCSTEVETDRATWCFGVDADALRERLVDDLRALRWSDASAVAARKRAYADRSLLRPGDPLDWRTVSGAVDERGGSGTYTGLGEFGELRVRDATGVERSLTSEEIRLRIR